MGNGGYVCGRIAAFIDAPAAEVTLRHPIPLGTPLSVHIDGTISLNDGEDTLAEARAAELSLEPPLVPTYSEAARAALRFVGLVRHGFPGCFVCGPSRHAGDGLRIFPGRLGGHVNAVAAPWTPDASLTGPDGTVRPEFIWSALDCPGAFALMGDESKPMLLGRLAAQIHKAVRADAKCVALAWRIGVDGKKQIAGSVLLDESGSVAAAARAIWFE